MSALRTVRRAFSEAPVRRSVLRILRENVLCSLSSVSPGNRAHVNTAYFCYSPDLELFFLSDPRSRHSRNLKVNPSAAIAVFRSSQTWGRPDRGIQLFGACREAREPEVLRAERLYARRFPLYARWIAGTTREERTSAALLRTYRFYCFLPRKVKILDERVFGGGVFVLADIRRAPRYGETESRKPA